MITKTNIETREKNLVQTIATRQLVSELEKDGLFTAVLLMNSFSHENEKRVQAFFKGKKGVSHIRLAVLLDVSFQFGDYSVYLSVKSNAINVLLTPISLDLDISIALV